MAKRRKSTPFTLQGARVVRIKQVEGLWVPDKDEPARITGLDVSTTPGQPTPFISTPVDGVEELMVDHTGARVVSVVFSTSTGTLISQPFPPLPEVVGGFLELLCQFSPKKVRVAPDPEDPLGEPLVPDEGPATDVYTEPPKLPEASTQPPPELPASE